MEIFIKSIKLSQEKISQAFERIARRSIKPDIPSMKKPMSDVAKLLERKSKNVIKKYNSSQRPAIPAAGIQASVPGKIANKSSGRGRAGSAGTSNGRAYLSTNATMASNGRTYIDSMGQGTFAATSRMMTAGQQMMEASKTMMESGNWSQTGSPMDNPDMNFTTSENKTGKEGNVAIATIIVTSKYPSELMKTSAAELKILDSDRKSISLIFTEWLKKNFRFKKNA